MDTDTPSTNAPPERPTTPKANPMQANTQSTPHHPTMAAYSDSMGSLLVPDVSPYMLEDLKRHQTCDFLPMLKFFLRTVHERGTEITEAELDGFLAECIDAVLPWCNNSHPADSNQGKGKGKATIDKKKTATAIQSGLDEYCDKSPETARYRPAVQAFNSALEACAEISVTGLRGVNSLENRGIYQRNDPKLIYGFHMATDGFERQTTLKPDLIYILFSLARLVAGQIGVERDINDGNILQDGDVFRMATMEPQGPFEWSEVLSLTEIKEVSPKMGKRPERWDRELPSRFLPPLRTPQSVDETLKSNAQRVAETQAVVTGSPVVSTSSASVITPIPVQTSSTSKTAHAATLPSDRKTRSSSNRAGGSAPSASSEPNRGQKRQSDPGVERAAKKSKSNNSQPNPPSGQLRKKGTIKDAHALVQTTIYATEMLMNHVAQTHSIQLLMIDDCVHILYYDRENLIQSTGLNFIQHFPYFMVLLLAFQRMTAKDWGKGDFIPACLPPEIKITPLPLPQGMESRWLRLTNYFVRVNTEPLVSHYGAFGRSTRVLDVLEVRHLDGTPFDPGYKMVIKIQWTERDRPAEAHIIAAAQESKDSIYTQYIKGHIAEVVDWKEFSDLNTCDIREFLNTKQAIDHEATKSRVLRIHLMRRFDPITNLHGEEFRRVFWHVVHCHYHLWERGVHHRDISISNMMYTRDSETQAVRGVLNDFDLSTSVHHRVPMGKERTGTLPFMARQLLTEKGWAGEVEHIYRHDAESLVWPLFYVVGKRSVWDGRVVDVVAPRVDKWAHATSHSTCEAHKNSYLADLDGPMVSTGYNGLRHVVKGLLEHLTKIDQVIRVDVSTLVAGLEPTPKQVYVEMLKTDEKEFGLMMRTSPQVLQGVLPIVRNPGITVSPPPDILVPPPPPPQR